MPSALWILSLFLFQLSQGYRSDQCEGDFGDFIDGALPSFPTIGTYTYDNSIQYNPIQDEILVVYIQHVAESNVTSAIGQLFEGNSTDGPVLEFTIAVGNLAKPAIAFSDVENLYYLALEEHISEWESRIIGMRVSKEGLVSSPIVLSMHENANNSQPAVVFNRDKNVFLVAMTVNDSQLMVAEISGVGNEVLSTMSLMEDPLYDTVQRASATYNNFTKEYVVGADAIWVSLGRPLLTSLNSALTVVQANAFRSFPPVPHQNYYHGLQAIPESSNYFGWITEYTINGVELYLFLVGAALDPVGFKTLSSYGSSFYPPASVNYAKCQAVINSGQGGFLVVAEAILHNGTRSITFYSVDETLGLRHWERILSNEETEDTYGTNPTIAYTNNQAVVLWENHYKVPQQSSYVQSVGPTINEETSTTTDEWDTGDVTTDEWDTGDVTTDEWDTGDVTTADMAEAREEEIAAVIRARVFCGWPLNETDEMDTTATTDPSDNSDTLTQVTTDDSTSSSTYTSTIATTTATNTITSGDLESSGGVDTAFVIVIIAPVVGVCILLTACGVAFHFLLKKREEEARYQQHIQLQSMTGGSP